MHVYIGNIVTKYYWEHLHYTMFTLFTYYAILYVYALLIFYVYTYHTRYRWRCGAGAGGLPRPFLRGHRVLG